MKTLKSLTHLAYAAEGIGPSQYGTKGLINEKLAEIEEKYDLNTAVMADGFSRGR